MLTALFGKKSKNSLRILTPEDAYLYVKTLYENNPQSSDRELFYVVMLDKKNHLIGHELIAVGDKSSAIIDREILDEFLDTQKPDRIIISHNHPRGYAIPSQDDLDLTKNMRLLCLLKTKSINVVDHIIYSRHDFFSFVENNLMPQGRYYSSVKKRSFSFMDSLASSLNWK